MRVWVFHNNPPSSLFIVVDSEYEYAFSESGERLGLVDYWGIPEEDSLFFVGDNGILYDGFRVKGHTLKFEAKAIEFSLPEIQKRKKKALDLLGPRT